MLTDHQQKHRDDPLGDVAAAMELVSTLRAEKARGAPGFGGIFRRVDSGELLQGLDTLIPALMGVFDRPTNMVMPLVRRLRDQELVSEEFLPTATAVLTAAGLGRSPLSWRGRFGRVDAAETAEWAHIAAQLADLVDHTVGEGTAARLMNHAFGGLPEESRETSR